MTFRSDATEGVWSLTQNVAVQTEANVVAIFFFHQCGFYDPTHHIRGCQKIIWNFALKGRALAMHARPRPTQLQAPRSNCTVRCDAPALSLIRQYTLATLSTIRKIKEKRRKINEKRNILWRW